MAKISTLTFTEASVYEDSFAAVSDGTATLSQAQEVLTVIQAIGDFIRPIGVKAAEMVNARAVFLTIVPEDKRSAIAEVLDGKNAALPRIEFEQAVEAVEAAIAK